MLFCVLEQDLLSSAYNWFNPGNIPTKQKNADWGIKHQLKPLKSLWLGQIKNKSVLGNRSENFRYGRHTNYLFFWDFAFQNALKTYIFSDFFLGFTSKFR